MSDGDSIRDGTRSARHQHHGRQQSIRASATCVPLFIEAHDGTGQGREDCAIVGWYACLVAYIALVVAYY